MVNQISGLAATIDDYLLSIAAGLRKAQEEFDALAAGPDSSGVSYTVPKLDFSLKMTVNLSDAPAVANKYIQRNKYLKPNSKYLLVAPISMAEAPATNLKAEAISTIDASFVAVPANGGKPPLLMESSIREVRPTEGEESSEGAKAEVTVEVFRADGLPVENISVEFNVDRDASLQLNENRALKTGTAFEKAVIKTDESGIATALLEIAETKSSAIVITIDVENQTEIINYQFPGS